MFRSCGVLCLIFAVVFHVSSPRQQGAFILLLVWPHVASDKHGLRPDMCDVSQAWHVMSDICCYLSSVLFPTVRRVSVDDGVATSRVGQTDTEARHVCCVAS